MDRVICFLLILVVVGVIIVGLLSIATDPEAPPKQDEDAEEDDFDI